MIKATDFRPARLGTTLAGAHESLVATERASKLDPVRQ